MYKIYINNVQDSFPISNYRDCLDLMVATYPNQHDWRIVPDEVFRLDDGTEILFQSVKES